MPERNAKLFHAIADHIDEHPENYNQALWITCEEFTSEVDYTNVVFPMLKEGVCGTKACIAGWAVALSWDPTAPPRRTQDINFESEAAELLGLTYNEAEDLFDAYWGPEEEGETVADALRKIAAGEPIHRPHFPDLDDEE